MKKSTIPTMEELKKHAKVVQEIEPASVIVMLRVLQAAKEIKHAIIDVLEKDYQISEGKFHVMIILHQFQHGLAPSELANRVGVTKATISVMLRRMMRDEIVYTISDDTDARAKKICLTRHGRNFMDKILPEHYLRITKLMGKLSEQEQSQLIFLLKKIVID